RVADVYVIRVRLAHPRFSRHICCSLFRVVLPGDGQLSTARRVCAAACRQKDLVRNIKGAMREVTVYKYNYLLNVSPLIVPGPRQLVGLCPDSMLAQYGSRQDHKHEDAFHKLSFLIYIRDNSEDSQKVVCNAEFIETFWGLVSEIPSYREHKKPRRCCRDKGRIAETPKGTLVASWRFS